MFEKHLMGRILIDLHLKITMQCYWIAFPKNYFIVLIWNFQIDIVLEYYYAITTHELFCQLCKYTGY